MTRTLVKRLEINLLGGALLGCIFAVMLLFGAISSPWMFLAIPITALGFTGLRLALRYMACQGVFTTGGLVLALIVTMPQPGWAMVVLVPIFSIFGFSIDTVAERNPG